MRSLSYCGVILAAGASSRMGRDKALLSVPGTSDTFLSSAIDALQSETDMVIVVAGANEEALRSTVFSKGGYIVVNPEPERGQLSSMQIGLQAVLNQGRDSAIVTLVDRPAVSAETIAALKAEMNQSESDVWTVIPSYLGEHGHPLIVTRQMIEGLLRAPWSSSARDVLHFDEAKIRYVEIDDARIVLNVNTPEEYDRLTAVPVVGEPWS